MVFLNLMNVENNNLKICNLRKVGLFSEPVTHIVSFLL